LFVLVQVDVTLWTNQAVEYNEQKLANNPVMLIKGARVSDFGGSHCSSLPVSETPWY
jgi:hypothetical protein